MSANVETMFYVREGNYQVTHKNRYMGLYEVHRR